MTQAEILRNSFGKIKTGELLCPHCSNFHPASEETGYFSATSLMAKDTKGWRDIQLQLDCMFSQYTDGDFNCEICREKILLDTVYGGGEFLLFEMQEQFFL